MYKYMEEKELPKEWEEKIVVNVHKRRDRRSNKLQQLQSSLRKS